MHKDEVTSARMLLEQAEGLDVENIPVREQEGRPAFAYAFKDVLAAWGTKVVELALDSTCELSGRWRSTYLQFT